MEYFKRQYRTKNTEPKTVQFYVLTDRGQTVQCDVVTSNGQILEDNSGHTDTVPTDGIL